MATALKPMINTQNTIFDALKDFSVTFSWTGNQGFKNRIVVIDNDTSETVYDDTKSSTQYNHTIPSGTLSNGNQYTIQVQVYDTNNNASELSDKVFFRCVTTPTFVVSNVSEGDYVEASTFTVLVNYSQEEDELLKDYQFYLYDGTGNTLLTTSNILFSVATIPTVDLTYTFNGLENEVSYYVECKGTTINGFAIDTGKVLFHIRYVVPSTFSTFVAECDPIKGYVKYNTNIAVIECSGDPSEFDIEDSKVDIRGKELEYNEAIDISGDFLLGVKCGKLGMTNDILTISNGVDNIVLNICIYDKVKRFKLTASNAISEYVLYSEPLTFNNTNLITVWIKRVDNHYDLKVFKEDDVFDAAEIYYCYNEPTDPMDEAIWIIDNDYASKMLYVDDTITYEQENEPLISSLNEGDIWFEEIE